MAEGEAIAASAGLPWPTGDVAGLHSTAGRLVAAARSFGDLGSEIGGLSADDAGWAGHAASRFDASVSAEGDTIGQASDGLADASRALRTLADVVAEAQTRVARLAHQVLALEDQAARAAHIAAWTTPDRPDSHAAQRAGRVAARLDGELLAMRERAVARAEEAREDVRRADRHCATTLSSLAGSAPLAGDVAPTLPATPLATAVAVAYAPQFRFDEDEDHFPMDVREWLANADDKEGDQGPYFDPQGEDIRNGNLAGASLPFAYHVTPDGDVQLEYGTFYAFNDFPDDLGVSDHEGDFEPVTVQLGDGGRPSAVDFEAHGHSGAERWDDVDRRGLHPQVYVTHGGHGNHPEPGRYESDFSDGHDVLRNHWEDDAQGDGHHWHPGAPQVVDARSIPELRGDTRFGEDKGDGNPLPFLHPDQGPPPDLDETGTPEHATQADGLDDVAADHLLHRVGRPW